MKYELPVYASDITGEWEDSWEVTEAPLGAFAREVESTSARFLLVGAPAKWEVYPEDWAELVEQNKLEPYEFDLDGLNRRLAEVTQRRGIESLDLRPGLREATQGGPRLHFNRYVHWTAAGHDRVATILSEALR